MEKNNSIETKIIQYLFELLEKEELINNDKILKLKTLFDNDSLDKPNEIINVLGNKDL